MKPSAPGRGPPIDDEFAACGPVDPPMSMCLPCHHAYSDRPEQSIPYVPAPRPMPYDGPPGPPPPHEYGRPIWLRAAWTTGPPEPTNFFHAAAMVAAIVFIMSVMPDVIGWVTRPMTEASLPGEASDTRPPV